VAVMTAAQHPTEAVEPVPGPTAVTKGLLLHAAADLGRPRRHRFPGMLMVMRLGTFIINFSGPGSPQRHDRSHLVGHTLSCTPFPKSQSSAYLQRAGCYLTDEATAMAQLGSDIRPMRGRRVSR
jgi:hypothetical protein